MCFYWLLVFLVTVDAYELRCDLNATSWSREDRLPDALALKDSYKVVVRHTDWIAKTANLITESRTPTQLHITTVSRSNNVTHFVLGNSNYTYNESSCAALPDVAALPTLYVRTELAKIVGFSMADLINFILKHDFKQQYFEKSTEVVGGIDGVLWLGCDIVDKLTLQIEVAFAAEHSIASYSSSVKNPYVLSIHVAAFHADNKTTIANDSIDVVELEELPAETHLEAEIPEGLFCQGFAEAKIPATFPEKFEMSVDYTDVNGKVVHDIGMFYDGEERIFSMRLNAEADRDAPFVGNATIPKGITNIHIIHDFQYGIQYLLDAENNVCNGVGAIDENFGDVELLNASTKEIDLKKPAQLFLSAADLKFYHAGKRNVDGIPLDVYVTKIDHSTTTSTIVEMLYTTENWVFETAVPPFLHSIIQYHKDQSGKDQKTVIRVHSFRNGSATGVQRASHFVYPCLKLVEDSYLFVYLKNTTLKDLEKFGIERVREGLRGAVAHAAKVSVLRIANFFLKQLQDNVVAFFVLGDASGIKPANTRNRSNETNAEAAVNLLNTTLGKNDIAFTVLDGQHKIELKLSKNSLGTIPSTWGPSSAPSSFRGYTGGSMFVLGFFMLLIGIALGVGGVYFVWKRQRLSGLAYQVFE